MARCRHDRFNQWWQTGLGRHAFAEGASPQAATALAERAQLLWGCAAATALLRMADARAQPFRRVPVAGLRRSLLAPYARCDAWLCNLFTVVGKLPVVVGQPQFHTNHGGHARD
jgi:hypothetical protein